MTDGYDWSPGTTRLQADGPDQPDILVLFDGEGIYRGMLRVGESCLQFSSTRYDDPRRDRHWRDATLLWAALPAWVRARATDELHLHAIF